MTIDWCIIAPLERYSDYRYFQEEKFDARRKWSRKSVVYEIEHIIEGYTEFSNQVTL